MTKRYEVKTTTGLTVKANLNTKHRVLFPFAILVAILGILGTLIAASLPTMIVHILAAIVLVVVLVVVLNNKARYATIVFFRELPERLAATKTYGDKKPANHDD
jgi:Flp pilus assembly protein TadB